MLKESIIIIVVFTILILISIVISSIALSKINTPIIDFDKNKLSKIKNWSGALTLNEAKDVFITDFSGFVLIQCFSKKNTHYVFAFGITDGFGNFRLQVYGTNPEIQGHWNNDKKQQYVNFAPKEKFDDPHFVYNIWGFPNSV